MTVGLAPSAEAAIPNPPTKALPSALDARPPYEPQLSCDPRPKDGVVAFAALMTAQYKTGAMGTYRPCTGSTSEHYDSRALDWMLNVNSPTQKAIANSVTAWLTANNGAMALRFGINYIIWNHRIWGVYDPTRGDKGWAAYTGSVPHTDHIHFSFSWDGAMKRTSWWTGKATTVVDLGPCRVYAGQFAPLYQTIRTAACPTKLPAAPVSPYSVAVYGQTSAQIAVAQRLLKVTADGAFGSTTFNALASWQARAGVPVTGVLDKSSWARLVPNRAPIGALDSVTSGMDSFTVRGWALDPDTTSSIRVHVYVDGRATASLAANGLRPDVGRIFGKGANHGFASSIRASAGAHQVCVYAIDSAGGRNPQVRCATVDVNGTAIGALDTAVASSGSITVRGWALDPNTTSSIRVHVYVDGRATLSLAANGSRPDVERIFGKGANHGFAGTVSAAAGPRQVCVYAIDSAGGTNPRIACKNVTVP
jgi:peptidoglycan hydrolase-like protein with peptidoglycan-binding domain